MIWRLNMRFKLKETWKVINGFPDYEVSTFGNVRNVKTKKMLKPFIGNKQKPYLRVNLYNNGKSQFLYVHVLVAKAFLFDTGRNPDGTLMKGYHQVNHIDEDKRNNNVLNLEWCDNKYNSYYSGTFKKAQPLAVEATKKKVQCIETGIVYESTYDAERKLNLRKDSVCNQINPKQKNQHCTLPDGTKIHFKYI